MTLVALSGEWRMLWGIRHVVLAACALMMMLVPSAAADDDEQGPLAEFYSYLPAAPDIHLPEFSIPFWTDDLKKASIRVP